MDPDSQSLQQKQLVTSYHCTANSFHQRCANWHPPPPHTLLKHPNHSSKPSLVIQTLQSQNSPPVHRTHALHHLIPNPQLLPTHLLLLQSQTTNNPPFDATLSDRSTTSSLTGNKQTQQNPSSPTRFAKLQPLDLPPEAPQNHLKSS